MVVVQKCREVGENDCGRREGENLFFQDYCHDTEITIEKGEFLQEGSDFRSYEWTQGRRMPVKCIVQDKNGTFRFLWKIRSI